MPRGRKKSQSSGAPALRVVREGSEESSTAEDAPKIKDSRLEDDDDDLGRSSPRSSPAKSRFRAKITDYFSPRPLSPPILLPQVPCPPDAPTGGGAGDAGEADQASDRSEGDSGKENEEDPIAVPKWSSAKVGGIRALGARPKNDGEKPILTQSTVVTRSRSSPGNKMPLALSSTAFSRLHPEPSLTPPASPTKSLMLSASPAKSSLPTPTSPPTPHKIKLLDNEKGPAVSAFQKLKLSLTPKSNQTTHINNKTAQAVVSRGPKKRQLTGTSSKNLPAHSSFSGKQDKLSKAATSSHKVTEYFPIRRSERRPKNAVEKEHSADIEHHLLANSDDHLDISVEHFPEKGRGVVACRNLVRGEFVVEYAGDLIDVGIAKERESKYSLDLSTGCYMYYFKHKGKQYCIDATGESGRVGRLVNHSRLHPNLQTKVVTFKDQPRLILVARRDIDQGTELLYDYGDRSKESLQAHPWLAL